ncbi:MAG TPA: cytochrome c biogenesis protein CcdA [Patescibacteria group bacterium]|nr:cytochrome c biogenesis protein CcdA [Patescibacteria group bacterium]
MVDQSLSLLSVFIAGVLSFFSPCVLPLLPAYSAILTGLGGDGKSSSARRWGNSLSFMAGFAVVFILMGATASYLGQLFGEYQEPMRKLGAVFIIVMGFLMMGLFRISWLEREYRPGLQRVFRGPAAAFAMGIAFTAGWTPCTGPILAAVLMYAGTSASIGQGAFLLLVYTLGFAIPFLTLVLLCDRIASRLRLFYGLLPWLQRIAGLLLVIAGVLLYFDLMQRILGEYWNVF